MRILVVITNYGHKNDRYLSRLLAEYRNMPYQVDIIVLSNLRKVLGPDVRVLVEQPNTNRWSMPFESEAFRNPFPERGRANVLPFSWRGSLQRIGMVSYGWE